MNVHSSGSSLTGWVRMSDGISIPPRNFPRYTEHEIQVSNLDGKVTIDANTCVSEASPSYSPVSQWVWQEYNYLWPPTLICGISLTPWPPQSPLNTFLRVTDMIGVIGKHFNVRTYILSNFLFGISTILKSANFRVSLKHWIRKPVSRLHST